MAYSRVVATGDGTTTEFAINFALDYLQESDITCRVGTEVDGNGDPVYRSLTFLSTNLVEVAGDPPGDGVQVIFERTIQKNELVVNFGNGDQLDEENLDIAQKQAMMAVHEVLDGRFSVLTQDLNAGGNTVTNLKEPTADTDAATRKFVLDNNSSASAAAAAASAASAAADAVTTSDNAAVSVAAVTTTSDNVDLSNAAVSAAEAAKDATLAALSTKADIASPALSGVPTAPTATAGTNTDQLATTAFVTNATAAPEPIATLCVTFDNYHSAYDNAAMTFMTTLGVVGTQFIIPENIDAGAGGSENFSSDEIGILLAKGWEIGAYGSSVGQTQNLQEMYNTDRASTLARLMGIRTIFRGKNIDVVAIAPMQRAWYDPQLTEMSRAAGFKVARVVSNGTSSTPLFESYPVEEPLNILNGGDAISLGSATTAAYLNGLLDSVIAQKALWVVVVHGVGLPADAYTVDPQVLEDFLTYAVSKRTAGTLRITTLSKAMTTKY